MDEMGILDTVDSSLHKDASRINVPKIKFPTREELPLMGKKDLGMVFLNNNQELLQRVENFGAEHIPYFGLHGRMVKNLANPLEGHKDFVEVVTVLEKENDPKLMLADLYDAAGGDLGYYARSVGEMLFILDLGSEVKVSEEKPTSTSVVGTSVPGGRKNTGTMAYRWGSEGGEVFAWPIGQVGRGLLGLPRYFENNLGLELSSGNKDILSHFEEVDKWKGYGTGRRPKSEKSGLTLSEGEFKKRLLGIVTQEELPMHLFNDISKFSNPENYERAVMAEMVFVQTVVEKLLDIFEKHSDREPHI